MEGSFLLTLKHVTALSVSKTSDIEPAPTRPQRGGRDEPCGMRCGLAVDDSEGQPAEPGQPQNHCPLTAFSLPTCLTRSENINRSVCLKIRLLVSSLVAGFAADSGCFHKL